MTLLLCLFCLVAGFTLGRLKRQPVRRIKIRTLDPGWDHCEHLEWN